MKKIQSLVVLAAASILAGPMARALPPPPAAQPPPAPPAPPPQAQGAPPAGNPPQAPGAQGFGAPLSGLTVNQTVDAMDGTGLFVTPRTPATGLGPIFNDVSCAACHATPSVGGWGRTTTTRFGQTAGGVFNPLTALDGTLLHARTTIPALQEVIPAHANVTARRLTTPLYGAGLVEAIPDATIKALAAAAKPAGIAGRAALVLDVASNTLRVGRFGWKAQQATILSFTGDAFDNEIGVTNALFPTKHAPDGNTALLNAFLPNQTINDTIDPATGLSGIQLTTAYLEVLAPPPPGPATAHSAQGAKVFATINCAACHVPSQQTGTSPIAALSNKAVNLYSDLLLHNMGSLGDGIAQGDAGTQEMRTAPLWGLRTRDRLLHDGRAQTVDQAILGHDGEAAGSRTAYTQLSAGDRQALLEFLGTL